MRLKLAAVAVFVLLFTSLSFAQPPPTLINVLTLVQKCPTPAPAFVIWTGSTLQCVALPVGWTVTGTPPVLTVPAPAWTVETVSLASLPAGSTVFSFLTVKTPVSGIVNYWYNATNLADKVSGAVAFTGQPLSFTLPLDWAPTDSITVSYQWQ